MNSKILHTLLFTPAPEGFWGLPFILWGEPGTGKTHFVKDAGTRAGMVYERLSPAERGEGQFGVVPVPNANGYLDYPAPAWASKFSNGGLLFLDEINTAPPAIQAPLLGLAQLRTIGSYTFPTRTRVGAAANETMDAAGGWDLAPALANRFGHYEFEGLDAKSWGIGILGGFAEGEEDAVSAEAEEARVMAAWPSAMATAAGMVAAFVKSHPALLHARPTKAAKSASRAWPSRRTVHYAATALASASVHKLSEIDADTMIAGFVGMPWVTEFRMYAANLDLPDPADVLDGKVQFKHDQRRLDRTMATLGACSSLVVTEKDNTVKKTRGNRCWEIIGKVLDDAADVAVPAARVLINAKLIKKEEYPKFIPIGQRLWPLLQQAGVGKAA